MDINRISLTKIEVNAVVESINLHYGSINLLCVIKSNNILLQESFNYSSRWKKHELIIGDKLYFHAIQKTMHDVSICIDTGEIDEFNELPPELTETKDIHKIINVSKIQKPNK